jgi:predicted DsbA family dithiol-disulfide isomerase
MSASPERLTVYADYVCPFCFLGRESLSRYQDTREQRVELEWHPFDLRGSQRADDGSIDPDAESGKDEAYYEEARANVRRLADRYDVDMAQEIASDVDSRNAQLVSVNVQMNFPDDWLAFDEALYDGLWRDGRDIGDPKVLTDLASDVGVGPQAVEDALSDAMVERRLEDRFEAARIRGVSGVPTFVYDGHTVRGAVPPAQLRRLVEGE